MLRDSMHENELIKQETDGITHELPARMVRAHKCLLSN